MVCFEQVQLACNPVVPVFLRLGIPGFLAKKFLWHPVAGVLKSHPVIRSMGGGEAASWC